MVTKAVPWVRHAGALAFFVLVAWICVFDLIIEQPVMIDFYSFYGAASAAQRGFDPYDFQTLQALVRELNVPRAPLYPYLYPPFFAFAFSWLGALQPATAQKLWSYASFIAYGGASLLAVRAAMQAVDSTRARIPAPLLVLASLLTFVLLLRNNMALGQINTFVLVLMCAAILLSLSGRFFWAGFALAFAAAIKITPIILVLPWLLERRARALYGFGAGLGAAFLLTLPFGGAGAWVEFASRLPTMSHGSRIPGLFETKVVFNFSLAGFYARLFDSAGAVRTATLITLLALVAITIAIAMRYRASYERLLLPLSVLMIVASPFAYMHHIIYLMPALLFALYRALREDRRILLGALIAVTALAVIDFPLLVMRGQLGTGAIASSMNLYPLLALWGIGIWSITQNGMSSSGPPPPPPP